MNAALFHRIRRALAPVLVPIRKAKERLQWHVRKWKGLEPRERAAVRVRVWRLGSGDGEWAMADCTPGVVYSCGVGKDIRFERDLLTRMPCELHAFDPTPVAIRWIQSQQLPAGFHFHEWGIAGTDGTARFSLPTGHNVSFVMSQDGVEAPVKRISTLMRELNHTRIDVLKMDIEGAEYAVLQDIVRTRPDIGQILVEFHHRMPGHTLRETEEAIRGLRSIGYEIFDISPRGSEYGFVRLPVH